MGKKFYTCRSDKAFKYVILNNKHKKILEAILEEIFKEKIIIKRVRPVELIEDNISVKGKIVDGIIESTGKLISIELNAHKNSYYRKRDSMYLFNLYNKNVEEGEIITEDKDEIVQINLTYGMNKKEEIKSEFYIQTLDGKKWIKDFKIIEINMTKIMMLWYNKSNNWEKYKYLIMLDLKEKEIDEYLEGDEIMSEYKSAIKKANTDPRFQAFMTPEEEEKLIRNTERYEGEKKGIRKNKLETAKNMLKDKLDLNLISKYTGLSKSEIEKLKEA